MYIQWFHGATIKDIYLVLSKCHSSVLTPPTNCLCEKSLGRTITKHSSLDKAGNAIGLHILREQFFFHPPQTAVSFQTFTTHVIYNTDKSSLQPDNHRYFSHLKVTSYLLFQCIYRSRNGQN